MNAFDFFELPLSLQIDLVQLKKLFYEKSRALHPDFHTLSDQATQDRMVEQSALNNKAYRILSKFNSRLKHLLELNDILKPEGENSLPQEFLFEMMEMNEAVMDLQMDPSQEAREKLIEDLDHAREDVHNSASHLMDLTDLSTISEDDWNLLLNVHLKSTYLARLESNLQLMTE